MTRLAARVGDALLWVTASVGVAAVAITAVMWVTGSRPVVVQSGSMEPSYPTGAVAVVHRVSAADVQEGDVVAVTLPGGQRVLHRIVDLDRTDTGIRLRTKGDANEDADAEHVLIPSSAAAWRAGAAVPGAGQVAAALRSPVAGFALGVVLLGPLALGRRRPAAAPEPAPA